MTMQIETYNLFYKNIKEFCHYRAYKAPKNAKNVPKRQFLACFAIFKCLLGP